MRELELQRKLVGMQKSTESQLEEKVTGKIEKAVPRTVKSILSAELKTNAFKNKKQKVSEHSSNALNDVVLQTVDYAGSSTNTQNNHRGREFFLELVGTSQNWPK